MTYVILDTNAIYNDYLLQFPQTRWLLENAAAFGLQICLPEVVIREITAQFNREIQNRNYELATAHNKLSKLFFQGRNLDPLHMDIVSEQRSYSESLKAVLEQFGVKVLPIPNVTVESLLNRDLDHRKPFKENGDGMRDTLIWETIVELSRADETARIVIITGDKGSFADSSNEGIAPELLQELGGTPIEARNLTASVDTTQPQITSRIVERYKQTKTFNELLRNNLQVDQP